MFVLGMLPAGGNVHGSPSNSSGILFRRPAHLLDAPATITSRSRNSNSDSMFSSLIGAIEVPMARSILRSRNSRNNLSRTASVICIEPRGCRRVSISTTAGTNPAAKGPLLPMRCLTDRWVEQRLNILHALSEFIENGDASPDEGSAVQCRLDAA